MESTGSNTLREGDCSGINEPNKDKEENVCVALMKSVSIGDGEKSRAEDFCKLEIMSEFTDNTSVAKIVSSVMLVVNIDSVDSNIKMSCENEDTISDDIFKEKREEISVAGFNGISLESMRVLLTNKTEEFSSNATLAEIGSDCSSSEMIYDNVGDSVTLDPLGIVVSLNRSPKPT